jgi:hypothetical protein
MHEWQLWPTSKNSSRQMAAARQHSCLFVMIVDDDDDSTKKAENKASKHRPDKYLLPIGTSFRLLLIGYTPYTIIGGRSRSIFHIIGSHFVLPMRNFFISYGRQYYPTTTTAKKVKAKQSLNIVIIIIVNMILHPTQQ